MNGLVGSQVAHFHDMENEFSHERGNMDGLAMGKRCLMIRAKVESPKSNRTRHNHTVLRPS